MAKFNEYTVKATPEDADTLMLYDATSKSNKLSPFSGIWNWIVGKLTNAVISNLQTNNKTVLGAINELNSKALITYVGKKTTNGDGIIPVNNIIPGASIKNVISAKAYISDGNKNIYSRLYSYNSYAYILVTDYEGNRFKNTELNVVVLYIK
jgi:hypothetical protein|nr:MAG TPA: hypothetical protein [Caudoviricetes sp.]